MGDRSVVGFAANAHTPVIYLYSHWGGAVQIPNLQTAIGAAQSRWHDADYATRIAISHIIGDNWSSETGYGLSVDSYTYPDYPYMFVVVWDERVVEIRSSGSDRNLLGRFSFEDFMNVVSESEIFSLV